MDTQLLNPIFLYLENMITMSHSVPIVVTVFSFVILLTMTTDAYALIPFFPADFDNLHGLKKVGNYTVSVTLTEKYKKFDTFDSLKGEIGYAFTSRGGDHYNRTKVQFYQNVDVPADELPKTFYLNISLPEAGSFTITLHTSFPELKFSRGGNMWNSLAVVEDYGMAVNEDGKCKTSGLHRVIRPDYSSMACVSEPTKHVLKERGWH